MNSESKNTLQLIAKIFMVISCVAQGIFLIPLIWCVPMTMIYFKKVKNGEPVSLAFKICCLLFVNMISGVIMLLDNDNK